MMDGQSDPNNNLVQNPEKTIILPERGDIA